MDEFLGGKMLYKLHANKASFKPIEFKQGLNLIVAERTADSDAKNSCNAVGKTTLIEIIDFCLGSKFDKKSKLNAPELEDWSFTLDFEVSAFRCEATRFISDPNKIYVHTTDKHIPFEVKEDKEKSLYVDIEKWRSYLGKAYFNLDESKYISFRSIISFFIRKKDAYQSPFKAILNEKAAQTKVRNAFVLNLLWQDSLKLSDAENEIKQKNKIVAYLKAKVGSSGKMISKIASLSATIEKIGKDIDDFNVLPEYENVQKIADSLTHEIQNLVNRNIFLKKKLKEYLKSTENESLDENVDLLKSVYAESEIVFSDKILQTLNSAIEFHKEIVENRKNFLSSEILKIKNEIENNEQLIKEKSDERTDKMKILQSHGALSEYSKLQDTKTKYITELESLNRELDDWKEAGNTLGDLKKLKNVLSSQIENDIISNENLREEIVIFKENSMKLYNNIGDNDKVGILVVEQNGKKNYDFKIDRGSSSEGLTRMDVFCYDLMLLEMFKKNVPNGIDFLIHDSTLYDPVDSRQRAKAIELARGKTEKLNAQYIFTLNFDQLPNQDLPEGFNLTRDTIRTLQDGTITDSALGIHFSSPLDDEDEDDLS